MHSILIVDDDPGFSSLMRRMLTSHNDKWRLYFADSVDEAVKKAAETSFDLIICDVIMPGASGFDLLKQLKSDNKSQNIPFIMVTGALEEEYKIQSLEMGAADLLTKPLKKADLIARISNCLKLKTYHDRILQQNITLEIQLKEQTQHARLASEIGSILVKSHTIKDLLQMCCQAIVDHLDVGFARIWTANKKTEMLELSASAGMYTHIDGDHQYIPIGTSKVGRIASEKKPYMTNSVIGNNEFSDQAWAEKEKMIAFAGFPLIAQKRLTGVMVMFSKHKVSQTAASTLSSIADEISLGIVQRKSDDKVYFYSYYDPLTQLPNRRFFNVFLGKMVHYANRYRQRFALAIINIDNFSRINQSLGHATGDKCLQTISRRVSRVLRNSDCLARLSEDENPIARMEGDEFAVLLHSTEDIPQLSHALRRILDEISRAITLPDRELILSASIGIAVYPEDARSIADLLSHAKTALDYVKEKGKNNFSFFSHTMNSESLLMLDLEVKLRKAISSKQFLLYYQPKVCAEDKRIMGAEALIRWKDDQGNMISPAQFIPLAESTGLILPIGDWVIESACRQMAAWQKYGRTGFTIAVNISGRQFSDTDFVKKTLTFIEESGTDPSCLELEVTETILMADPQKAADNLNALKKSGITISLDDFGTGYSSLSYLQKLPIDYLKIDLSFIKNILTNNNDAVMVNAMISMAHNLGLKVVAEGVEEQAQFDFLKDIACDVMQGYLFSPPVPANEFPLPE